MFGSLTTGTVFLQYWTDSLTDLQLKWYWSRDNKNAEGKKNPSCNSATVDFRTLANMACVARIPMGCVQLHAFMYILSFCPTKDYLQVQGETFFP